jgi:Flp pilus assembly protein TadG
MKALAKPLVKPPVKPPVKPLARCIRDCTLGAAAVEFAIVSGVLIALLIGTIDFGRTLLTQHQISSLADQAVRKVLLDPDVSGATLESELRAEFTAGDPGDLTVAVTTESAGSISYRVVTVGYPMTLFIPGLDSDVVSLSVTRRVPEG